MNKVRMTVIEETMSNRFVNVDRETPMLLPPDMREWVKDDDLAHFLIDALEIIDVSAAVTNRRGTGSPEYPPGMMLAVLVYCYAHGMFSSRQIERATYRHLSVRYLAGNTHPDHDTIATFRRRNGELLRSAFLQILQLAKQAGLLRLGTIAIDGTKLEASATKRKTVTYQQLQEQIGQLNNQIEQLLQRAETEDANDAAEQELPEELIDANARRARLLAAKAQLEEQVKLRHEEREKERDTERGREKPRRLPETPKPSNSINTTDPESGLMPTAQQRFIQGYNGQVAVAAESGLIVAAEVVTDTNDIRQLQPMMEKVVANIGAPTTVLVDTGYENTRQIQAIEQQYGCTVYCPPARIADGGSLPNRRSAFRESRRRFRQQLRARLEEPAAKLLYRVRSSTVEPTIGIIKSVLGLRRFLLRGLSGARAEWTLIALAFNCRKLAFLN